MRQRGVAALAASILCLAACEALESDADRKSKDALAGVWFIAVEEPDETAGKSVTLRSWLSLTRDGKFTEIMTSTYADGRVAESRGSGEWTVTDDLFKLRYLSLDGRDFRWRDSRRVSAFKVALHTSSDLLLKWANDEGRPALAHKRVAEMGREPGK